MKRIICLMLCALAAVTVCACDKDNTQTATEAATETAQVQETEAATPDESGISLKSYIASFDKTPTVEEEVVYEDKDLKITLTGIDYAAISGPGLKFQIESTCSKGVIVQSPYAVVNGYMVSPEMNIDVPENKTVTGTHAYSRLISSTLFSSAR